MNQISLDIKKELSCDVLVLGGGCSGLAAAVCSARHGATTILAEANGYLGGTATAGLVGPFMTSYDVDGEVQLIRGFFDEFVTRMEARGGAVHPSKADFGTAYTAYRSAGHRNCTAFSAEVYKSVADEMCIESGVKVCYHFTFVKSEVTDGKITAAYFATKAGIYKINAKVFIDCSGDADLAADSGAPTVLGDENGELQAASLFFTVKGVDKKLMDEHMFSAPDMETKFYMKEIEAEREKGNYPLYRSKIMLFEGIGGEWVVNMSQIDDLNPLDPEAVSEAEMTGRKQIDYILNLLRKYAAGCKDIYLCKSAAHIGIRESRRIIGEYVVTKEDAIKSVKFEDSVMCCSNSMDIHKKGYVDYIARDSKEPYYIPYRALQAKGTDNLLVAGRCASAEREVIAAIRVMPPCFAMGQAAGTAAALAIEADKSPKEINTGHLAATLRRDGVYIK